MISILDDVLFESFNSKTTRAIDGARTAYTNGAHNIAAHY